MRVWQVRAVLSLAPFIEPAINRPTTPPPTSTIPLAVFDCLSYTKHCCRRCDSDNRQQQQSSIAEGVLTPADYEHPLPCFDPGPQQQLQQYEVPRSFMVLIVSYNTMCTGMLFASSVTDVGRLLLVLTPLPQARPGGEPCIWCIPGYVLDIRVSFKEGL